MSLAEKIIEKVERLPQEKQAEILDFVDYLHKKHEKQNKQAFHSLSLASAMDGLEEDGIHYSIEDLKENF